MVILQRSARKPRSGRSGLALSISALGLAGIALAWWAYSGAAGVAEARETRVAAALAHEDPSVGPGILPVDAFHPDRRPKADGTLPPLPEPAYGGRVIVHLESNPRHLCAAIENSSVTRRILFEVHETLLLRDWETTEWKPDLALRYDVQDRLVLKPGARPIPPDLLVGAVIERGATYIVDPKPGYEGSIDIATVPKEDVQSIERGTVLTFRLRPGVKWHDGHAFDARDVAFSWEIYGNPKVDCGEKRSRFEKFEKVEVLDYLTVRFTSSRQYFHGLETIGDMCILPAHLYDLSDPDNEDGKKKRALDPSWKPSEEEQGRYVNENPKNRDWVGLGPYKITGWTADGVEARRFDGYFDPKNAGYFDAIRWRAIPNFDAAFQAAIHGEVDFLPLMTTQDYFGESSQAASFTDRCYKGYFYTSQYWYVGWNLYRPTLQDARVRAAIAMLFDFEGFRRSFYKGLAVQVTGPFGVNSPGYERELAPLPRDPKRAAEILDEAGWTDHDGDQVRDRDGIPLDIEILVEPNKVGEAFGAKLQEDLAKAGVRLRVQALEKAATEARRLVRDFDAYALGWAPPIESDPEQLWHSKWGARDVKSSNYVGFQDAKADELIERGQRELDPKKRAAIWRELHRRIYELQPYLFCYNAPRKFAMNQAIRGFQSVPVDPNYVVRRWYYPAGTPGTRPTLAAKPGDSSGGESGGSPKKDR